MKWKPILKWTATVGVLVGAPIYLSTDSFLRWILQTAVDKKWSNAPSVTMTVGGYYRYTLREDRASEVYADFVNRWPQHDLTPDAQYNLALSLREWSDRLQTAAHGDPVLIERRRTMRDQAAEAFDNFAEWWPDHPKAEMARTAARNIRAGY